MAGDDQRRFCDRCQLPVHNLSAMTAAAQEALLAQRAGRRCVAYLATDRSIRVRTGTWLFWQRLLRPWRAGLALAAVVLPFGASGCATSHPATPPPKPDTKACQQLRELPDGKWTMGEIICDPPLWRRVLFFWER